MKFLKRRWTLLLAVCFVILQGFLFSVPARAAAAEDTVGESPFKMTWKEGDPTSSDPAKYQIYPIPQNISYPDGEALTLSGEVKIAVGGKIDDSTKDYIKEVLEAENLTVSFVGAEDNTAQIRMGTVGDGSLAASLKPASITDLFDKDDAYMLTVADNKITILGKNTTAAFYGVATLKMMLSSLANSALVPVTIEDYADVAVRGIVEGFYGGFQDDHRKSEMEFCRDVKMNIFIYASKTDSYHDRQWAVPYPEERMNYFKELVALQEKTKCEFSWAVHTGYFFRTLTEANRETQMQQLKDKFQQFIDIGVRRFAMLNDDYGAGDVATVVSVVNEMNQWLTDQGFPPVAYCPQGYNVSWAGNGNEIRGLADLDDDILIFWTGRDVNSPFWKDSLEYVINNTKKADDANSYQKPMFWVNYPCNEHTGGRGLLLGSAEYYLKGDIKGLMGGAVSNPVEFAETNKIAFFQLANYFWNIEKGAENVNHTWEQAFKYLQPEVYDAYYTIARNACEAPGSGRIPNKIDESAYMASELEAVKNAVVGDTLTADNEEAKKLLAEFIHIQEAMTEFVEKCENKSLVAELANPGHLKGVESGEGWIQALDNLGRAGELLIKAELEMAGSNPNKDKIWGYFSEAVTEMERYNTRTHAYHGATDVQTRAGTKRILPFVNTLMADVETYINAQSSMTVFETPADRIYTNVSSLARTPLTIQENEFSVRGINNLSLPAGGYVGIKKAGIASITNVSVEGRGLDGLKLEYSLHGDSWTEVQAGNVAEAVQARYVRLRNAGTSAVTATIKKLGITVNNEEPKTKVTTNFPVPADQGAGDLNAVIDGNRTSYVVLNKNQAVNDYVTVDLGEVRPIHDIAFYTEDGSRYIYYAEVGISSNNESYTKIGEIGDDDNTTNIDPPFRKYEFNANGQEGRYVRLKITANKNSTIKLHEIEINQKAPEFNSGRVPSQLVIGTVSAGLDRINDGDTATLYHVENMAENGYLEYRITENTAVEKITIFQGEISNAEVVITNSEGKSEVLGAADELFKVFTVSAGKKVYSIRLNFSANTKVAISEIGLKCGADASGDVGEAVENIYLDEAPADSAERVNLALNQPVQAPSNDGNRPENAVDGNENTRWSGSSGNSGYFTVDLGLYTNIIEEIKVSYFNKVYPIAYSVKVSDNGEKWVELQSGTHTAGQEPVTDTVTLETPVVARYVKLEFTGFNTAAAVQNSVGIKELTVNGYRRTASMEYKSAEEPEVISVDVNGTVTLPELLTAAIEDLDGQSYTVDVIADWNPASIITSAAGLQETTAVLPVTLNLDNASAITCVQYVQVGQAEDETDVNLALNKPVTTSAVENNNTNWVGEKAVDGDAATRWSSGALNNKASGTVADQWIIVDLGSSPVMIKRIEAAYYNKVWPMQYRIELSNDQEKWTVVKTEERAASDNGNITDTVEFTTPISARYVRLFFPQGQLNTSAAGGAVSIKELTVRGDRLSTAVTYESLTDSFEEMTVDSTATVQDLELPARLNATWKKEGSQEAVAVQLLADWDTSAFEALTEGEAVLTAAPFTSAYYKNTNNLTASIKVIKEGEQTEKPEESAEVKALRAKVEEAKAIQAEGWTAASYQALQTALTEAEQLLEGTPTAQQATEMLEKLTTAIGGLTKEKEAVDTPDEIIAEVETLKAKVKEAKAIQAEGWTAASYQTLQNALTKAEQLLKGTPAAQQATEMLKQLTAAINGLTKEKAPVDKPVQKPFPFTDVKQITGNWKFESVKYVYNNDIMNGISGTTEFRPDATLTRGMFATVLYRMAGEPQITFKNTFSDVKAGKWYSNAIIWANQKGIVQGMGNGTYGVDLEITREQIAKMLNEYAKICQYDVSASKSLDSFTDAKDVSGWAVNYLKWAVAVEMIGGKPNDSEGTSYRLDPKGQATRAECAAMLMRFQNKYK